MHQNIKKSLSYIFLLFLFVYGSAQNPGLNLGNDWRNPLREQTPRLFFKVLDFNITKQYNTSEINLSITDTVIFVTKDNRRNSYAAKVNVEINVPVLEDTIFLYSFNECVTTNEFFCDMATFDNYRESSIGLQYIVENKNNHIMESVFILESFERPKDEIKSMNSRRFVTSKQKIKYRLLNNIERADYDRAKYEINNKKQNLTLYPLFGSFHYYLPKGEYYLYFVYSFNARVNLAPPTSGIWDSNKPSDSKIFRGSFVSNKVKLIVK